MTVLLWLATCTALVVAVVESQRADNRTASARYWHKVAEHAEHQTLRHQARIARLETALGRRPPGHWTPRRIRTADTSSLCPSDDWLAEWGVIAIDRPRLMGAA